jgi:phosphonate metabolism protein PhnN/1,5-bisphosphokinase (PRPP-forming)
MTVVGPSGAGKDTLLGTARVRLAGDPRFVFVRRAITRPAETSHHSGAEDHLPMTEEEFAASCDNGAFALHWQAHGLHYGIPASIDADLRAGRVVIANLSRAVLAEANTRYRLRVIEVTAPPEILAARLARRGRETAEEIAERLTRRAPLPAGLDVVQVVNDSTAEEGAARLLQVLHDGAASEEGGR